MLHLVAAARGLDYQRDKARVIAEAASLAGVEGRGPGAPRPPRRAPAPPPPPKVDEAYDRLARALLRLRPAASDPDVAAYLQRRGLLDAVGSYWGALPAGRRDQEQLRDALIERCGAEAWERSGLAGKRRGDVFLWAEHRLIIPWRIGAVDGAIVALQRRLVRELRPGEDKAMRYRGDSSRPVVDPYGAEDAAELAGEDVEVVYTEGAIDAVAYRVLAERAGRAPVVLGLPGVESWRPAWARWARGAVAIIALDGDKAGEGKVQEMARDLAAAGAARVLRARPVGGKDWAEVLTTEKV